MDNKEVIGWIHIQKALMNESEENIQEFINIHKDKLSSVYWHDKAQVVAGILALCVDDIELRKSLQIWFGQFENAQICECCGKVMWTGYSWVGHTYCSIECILEAQNTTLTEIDCELHNDDEINSECFYVDWN